MFKEGKISKNIIGIAMRVHSKIGPGFNEKIYHRAMIIALKEHGFNIESEKEFSVYFQNRNVGKFKVDLVVDNKIIIELKAVSGEIPKIFQSQVISYLKASGIEVGLLVNFGNPSIEIKRLARYKNYNKSV
jgi:GxxExxY protein